MDQTPRFIQQAFGLHIRSTSPLPGLPESSGDHEPDLRIWLRTAPPWLEDIRGATRQACFESQDRDKHDEPVLRVWKVSGDRYFCLRYSDETEFVVDRSGGRIWASWPESATLEDTATYLLGPVLGFVLRLRGTTCLHASGMAVQGRAIAVVGPAGAGKSTLAALFARRGFSVLTDDVLALVDQGDRFLVRPAYPRIRLWPESVSALFGSPEALPRLTPTWDKRYVHLTQDGPKFQDEPLPLGAVYVLNERRYGPNLPLIEPVAARPAIMNLVANTYAGQLLDAEMRASEFDVLGRLVAGTPVRVVTPHADPAYMSNLFEAILDDYRSLVPVNQS